MQGTWTLYLASVLFCFEIRNFAIAAIIDMPIVPFAMYGKIFDKRRDDLGSNVLTDSFNPARDLRRTKHSSTTTQYMFVETNQDANELLDIDGSDSLQLELGLVQGGASVAGGYLRSIDNRDNFVELLFRIKMQKDTVVLADNNRAIDANKCKNSVLKGTHIVTGIMYGATCIVSLRIKTDNPGRKQQVKAQVQASIGLGGKNVKIDKTKLNKLKGTLKTMPSVTVYTFCNTQPKKFPTTASEAIELFDEFPDYVKFKTPEGVPTRMKLTPINEITKCGSAAPWTTNLVNSYYENTVAMVQDLKTSYKQLWNCMEILVSSNDANSQNVKREAKALRDKMKKVNFKIKKFIDEVEALKNPSEFNRVKQIYTDNEPNLGSKADGNKFWRNKVNAACKKLETLKRQTDYASILVEKACSPLPDLIGKDITSSASQREISKSHDNNPSTCFEATGSDQHPVVWTAKLQRFARNLTAFEIFFNKNSASLGDVDIYISNSQSDFSVNAKPSMMHHVGHLDISHLKNNIGIAVNPIAIKGMTTGNSGYVTVVRLESKKRLSLCEVKVSGQLCPTIV